MNVNDEFKQRPLAGTIARSVAWVAALFSLIVAILLIADFLRLQQMDPLNDPVLLELRDQLADSNADNETLIEQIRTYDLYARRAFFANQEQRRSGGLLLLGGAVVCFVALQLARIFTPRRPAVEKREPSDPWELNAMFRQLMAGTAILLVVLSLFLAFVVQSDLSLVLARKMLTPPIDPVAAEPVRAALPETFRTNWPSLRGPGGIGVAQVDAPIAWDIEGEEGILWKSEVPVPGFNSPVVWGSRVFLTGADDEGQEVYCYHADSGELLWSHSVATDVELPEVSDDTGFAAPTMTTDGQRAFAVFASGELVAFDFDGNLVWQKNLGVPDNPYGMGSSLITDGQRLFVQFDHNENQRVIALDNATGELVWEQARAHISWSTPALIETESELLLVLNDEENVSAYDPATGAQRWSVKCLGGEVAPSPAFNGVDTIFVANEYAQATALKLGEGTPQILWQYDDLLPDIASPVAARDLFFIATSAGDIVCLDAATGAVQWEQEFDDGFNASPILVGDRIYALDLEGVVHIFNAAAQYEAIASIEMGERAWATPAFAHGRIYIRCDYNLYCIEGNKHEGTKSSKQ